MDTKGIFIISLDFELMWGDIEKWTAEGYGKSNVKQVRPVFDKMLKLFEAYSVKATVATVGFIMLSDIQQIIDHSPVKLPTYLDKEKNPYGNYLSSINSDKYPLYFAPDIIEELKRRPNIEIATHTLSHYYCTEKGQTIEQFEDDLIAACKVAEENGIKFTSIVFPRNQVSEEYLSICSKHGIKAYRGVKKQFISAQNKGFSFINRVLIYLDKFFPLKSNAHKVEKKIDLLCPINIPASRCLYPCGAEISFMDSLRLRRIKREIHQAAQKGMMYHLWWHPHNFGKDIDTNMRFLEEILKYYKKCNNDYGMESMTMLEYSSFLSR